MKKRILALTCALTLAIGMSLTVSATSNTAGDAAGDARKNDVVTVPNSTGQSLSSAAIEEFAETTTISSGVQGATISAVPSDTAKAIIAEANRRVGEYTFIASVVDLNVPAGTGKATFTLTCPNVWKGQKVSILHLKSDGAYEEIQPDDVSNNAVTFTMTSYSPIAIVIDTKAPKTEDAGLAAGMLIALLALAGAAGAMAYGRRARA